MPRESRGGRVLLMLATQEISCQTCPSPCEHSTTFHAGHEELKEALDVPINERKRPKPRALGGKAEDVKRG